MWAWVVWVRTLESALALIEYCWVTKVLGKLFFEIKSFVNPVDICLFHLFSHLTIFRQKRVFEDDRKKIN